MDAQAKKKAIFRAKLKAQKLEKRIDSPLVRYNENDQPVCRVCKVVLKSESSWQAHQVSAKHHEAIKSLKASAAAASQADTVKSESSMEIPECSTDSYKNLNKQTTAQNSSALPSDFFDTPGAKKPKTSLVDTVKPESSIEISKPSTVSYNNLNESTMGPKSSALPSDFFDKPEARKPKTVNVDARQRDRDPKKKLPGSAQTELTDTFNTKNKIDGIDSVEAVEEVSDDLQRSSKDYRLPILPSESMQVKGALPEGFFDDKDADLRARGITPVKPDIKDEYKEFEKLIQEDLQEVDKRLEEEEFDAAEMIEEAESVEQRTYRGRVEMLKRMKMERRDARFATRSKGPRAGPAESSRFESSSDDDSDDNFAIDWRAKHL